MAFNEFARNLDMCSRGTDIAVRARIAAIATEHLRFDRRRKILSQKHALGRLTVKHHAVVPIGPRWAIGNLFAYKAIFESESIMRIRFLRKQMSEFAIKGGPFVIHDSQ